MDLSGNEVPPAPGWLFTSHAFNHGVSFVWNTFAPCPHLTARHLVGRVCMTRPPFWSQVAPLSSCDLLSLPQPQPVSHSPGVLGLSVPSPHG